MPTLCACGDWHPIRRLLEAGGAQVAHRRDEWYRAKFLRHLRLARAQIRPKIDPFRHGCICTTLCNKTLFSGGNRAPALEKLVANMATSGLLPSDFIGISGVNYEKNGGSRRGGHWLLRR